MELTINGKPMERSYRAVVQIVVDRLGCEAEIVVTTTNFVDDLGADSLDLVEMIMSLEEEFGSAGKPLDIPDEEAILLETVGAVLDFLANKGISDENFVPVHPEPSPA